MPPLSTHAQAWSLNRPHRVTIELLTFTHTEKNQFYLTSNYTSLHSHYDKKDMRKRF